MIIGIGTDITDVHRIEESIEKFGERFLKKIFTETEREYCESFKMHKGQHYAARFAAKEAFSKAIGTGMRDGFSLNLVGIRNEPSGKPIIELSGLMAERWGECKIHISLSHSATIAMAMVAIEKD
ncbi:MAG: holo-ACP synthase [Ignavibacteriae bacterium]|nr:holo-ACP synthase [Ignavibacteriota bacterium]